MRELLGDDATEGDAEHVDAWVSEPVEHAFHGPGDAAHPARPGVRRGLTDARRVEADHLQSTSGERALERLGQLQAGAEPGDQQYRRPGAADRGAQPDAIADLEESDLGPVTRTRPHR